MDSKLSELSKPVAWVLHTRGGDVTTMDECYVANAEGMENIRSSSLYSQEYVSALLADNEAKDKALELEREKSRRVMSENHKQAERIAELEAKLNHYVAVEHARASFDQAADIIKRADDAEREVEELRTKLATPVRLPEGTGWQSDPYNHGRNDGIHQCADAIRASGFTVGDE